MFNLTVTWVPEDDETAVERTESIARVLQSIPTGLTLNPAGCGTARLSFRFTDEAEAWRVGALLEGDGMIVSYEVSKCPE
jgi:hypothetical protein